MDGRIDKYKNLLTILSVTSGNFILSLDIYFEAMVWWFFAK